MDIGFNVIEKSNPNIFKERMSIIQFIKGLSESEKFARDFAVLGLDSLLYYAEDQDIISKYIKNILQDNANQLVGRNYIIQIVVEGQLKVIDSYNRLKVVYKNKEIPLSPIFGRFKPLDVNHFHVPLNLSS